MVTPQDVRKFYVPGAGFIDEQREGSLAIMSAKNNATGRYFMVCPKCAISVGANDGECQRPGNTAARSGRPQCVD
jgi:hypothetical protein